MTLRRTVLLATTVPLIFMMGGTFALAQSHQRTQTVAQLPPASSTDEARPERGDRGMRWLEELNLSAEQSEQIQAIQEQSRTAKEGLHQQLQQAHEELRSLMASDASADQLRQQHQQVQNLKQQLDNQRFETMLEVREVLTSEQRVQLAELKQQHRGRHQGPRPQ
jgi:Spy/CpxP family protein refolding chaperone